METWRHILHKVDDFSQVSVRLFVPLIACGSGVLSRNITSLQCLVVQRTEELTAGALIAPSGMPRLEHVLLRKGYVGEECDKGIEVRNFLGTRRRVFDCCENTLKCEWRYEA